MKHISVIGCGTMGSGIAHCFAQYNHKVILVDLDMSRLQNALEKIGHNLDRQNKKGIISLEEKALTLDRITLSTDLQHAVAQADLVVEAASEDIEIKEKIFRQLDTFAPPKCILASNTSSLSISTMAGFTQRPEKVIGMHFMNPVPVMRLVEIITGKKTDQATLATIVRLTEKLEKEPLVATDFPGFVANRILMPMINEAIQALSQGVAEVKTIDEIMKLGMGHPMGPLQLADFIGLDVCLSILNVLYQGFKDDKYRPCDLLEELVSKGNLGVKTKQGFYDYRDNPKQPTPIRF